MPPDHEDFSGVYEGPFVITCDGPDCARTTLMEAGAPGPSEWLDLSSWDDETASAISLGYFCSVDCLESAIPTVRERFGSD